jgi:hypothetical protein
MLKGATASHRSLLCPDRFRGHSRWHFAAARQWMDWFWYDQTLSCRDTLTRLLIGAVIRIKGPIAL